MTGIPLQLRLQRGLLAFSKFIWNSNWVVFAVAFGVVLLLRKRSHLLLALSFLIVCAYSIYIGGDAWEHEGGSNRFISTVIPLVFILFALALETARSSIVESNPQRRPPRWLSVSILFVFVVVSLINLNALLDTDSLNYWLLRGNPLFVPASERNTTIGLYLKEITDEEATIAVVAAGTQPYFAERKTIDMLGKIDPVIARGENRIGSGQGLLLDVRPGHSKYDFAHSIGELQPDVVVEFLRGMTPEAKPFLEKDYVMISEGSLSHFLQNGQLYLLKESPHIDWERASKLIVDPE
jgi:hypothetical protein